MPGIGRMMEAAQVVIADVAPKLDAAPFIGEHGLASLGIVGSDATRLLAKSEVTTRFGEQVVSATKLLHTRPSAITEVVERFGSTARRDAFVHEREIAEQLGLSQDRFRHVLARAGHQTPFVDRTGSSVWSRHQLEAAGALDAAGDAGPLVVRTGTQHVSGIETVATATRETSDALGRILASPRTKRLAGNAAIAAIPAAGVVAYGALSSPDAGTDAPGSLERHVAQVRGVALGTGLLGGSVLMYGANPRIRTVGGLISAGAAAAIAGSVILERRTQS